MTATPGAAKRTTRRKASKGNGLAARSATSEPGSPRSLMLADLARSGLDERDAKRLKLQPLTADETKELTQRFNVPAYKIPYFDAAGDPTDFYRLRFLQKVADPDGKVIRYWQPEDSVPHAYFPPCIKWTKVMRNAEVVIAITEGEKKAAKACKTGIVTIGLGGVWNFQSKEAHIEFLAELAEFEWSGRRVEIVFDGMDAEIDKSVAAARDRLKERLEARGARNTTVELPPGEKLDDFLVEHSKADYDRLPRSGGSGLPALDLSPVPAIWFERRLPDPEYVVENYLPRGIVALLVAVGGAGKTNLTLQLAAAIAGGEPIFGLKTEPCRVAYIGLEDPPEVLRRRVHRIHQERLAEIGRASDLGRERRYVEKVSKNLTVVSLVGQQLHLITVERGGIVTQAPALEELIARLKAEGIGFLALDPMSRLHGADENANAIGTALVNAAERISRAAGCTVLVNHHTGKANAQSQNETAYAARGASGIADAARCVLVLRAIDQKEAEKIKNVDQLEVTRGDVMRLVHAKANYSKRAEDVWLRRGAAGGFTRLVPEFKDLTDDYADFVQALRRWAAARPGPFSKREVTDDSREAIFGKRVSRAGARAFFNQAVSDGTLRCAGGQRGGGEAYTLSTAAGGGA